MQSLLKPLFAALTRRGAHAPADDRASYYDYSRDVVGRRVYADFASPSEARVVLVPTQETEALDEQTA